MESKIVMNEDEDGANVRGLPEALTARSAGKKDHGAVYIVSDGAEMRRCTSLQDAAGMAAGWYGYLSEEIDEVIPGPDLDASSLEALNESIGRWEEAIAEHLGYTATYGNGGASAASHMGLNLSVEIEED